MWPVLAISFVFKFLFRLIVGAIISEKLNHPAFHVGLGPNNFSLVPHYDSCLQHVKITNYYLFYYNKQIKVRYANYTKSY